MRKPWYVVAVLILCLGLVGQVQAETTFRPWVGGLLGVNLPADSDIDFKAPPYKGTLTGADFNNSILVGLAAGVDLRGPVPFGLFGLMMDLTYNGLDFPGQDFQGSIWPASVSGLRVPKVDGYQWTLSFLVKLKPPQPWGRFEPYVALGPGVVWTTMDFASLGGPKQTSADPALVVEGGVKAYLDQQQRVSLDLAYRYRYCSPSFEFRRPVNYIRVEGNSHNHACFLRLAYHF